MIGDSLDIDDGGLLDNLIEQAPPAVVKTPTPTPPAGGFDKRARNNTPAVHARNVKRLARGAVAIAPRPSAYTVGGKTLAEGSASFLWLVLWLFNGLCTTLAWVAFVNWLAAKLHYDGIFMETWFQAIIGGAVHLIVSTMEQHLWRELDQSIIRHLSIVGRIKRLFGNVRLYESLLVGAIDSTTTARVILVALGWLGIDGMAAVIHAAWLGTALAMVSEPMLRLHGQSLALLVRGPERRN